MRNVILHYHFFKNAGTSFDGLLERNFPGRWAAREFLNPCDSTHQSEVAEWVVSEFEMVAFSSHTLEGPPPIIPGLNVIPYLFLRHPILRLRSVYDFERTQNPKQSVGSALAQDRTFVEYLEARLSIRGDHQCRNFHVDKLARWSSSQASHVDRAKATLRSLRTFGIVERFQESAELFARAWRQEFPTFEVRNLVLNKTNEASDPYNLDKIKTELGDAFFKDISAANRDDIELYDYGNYLFEETKTTILNNSLEREP